MKSPFSDFGLPPKMACGAFSAGGFHSKILGPASMDCGASTAQISFGHCFYCVDTDLQYIASSDDGSYRPVVA